jgi:hypothetical protein
MACLIAPIATVLIVNHLENKDKIMVRIVTLWHRLTLVTPLFDRQKSLYCSRENAFFFGKTHYVCFSDFVLLTHHNIILSLSECESNYFSSSPSSVLAAEAYKSK